MLTCDPIFLRTGHHDMGEVEDTREEGHHDMSAACSFQLANVAEVGVFAFRATQLQVLVQYCAKWKTETSPPLIPIHTQEPKDILCEG